MVILRPNGRTAESRHSDSRANSAKPSTTTFEVPRSATGQSPDGRAALGGVYPQLKPNFSLAGQPLRTPSDATNPAIFLLCLERPISMKGSGNVLSYWQIEPGRESPRREPGGRRLFEHRAPEAAR